MSISFFVFCEDDDVLPLASSYLPVTGEDGGGFSPSCFQHTVLPSSGYIGVVEHASYLSGAIASGRQVLEPVLNLATMQSYQLDDLRHLEAMLDNADVLTVAPIALPGSLRTHLKVSDADLALLLSLLEARYPEYIGYAHAYLQGRSGSTEALVVMHQSLFSRFWEFTSVLVQAFYRELDARTLSVDRVRSFRSLFPFLLQVFLSAQQDLRINYTGSVRFQSVKTPLFLPAWKAEAVAVVFASNEHFAPALGVSLYSLLEHGSAANSYDIVVLSSDLSEDSKARLQRVAGRYPNARLRFYNPQAILSGRKLQKNPTDHISMETYYRFLIADILSEYSKVLYLDCDTVILADVAELLTVDIQDTVLAACLDPEIPSLALQADRSTADYLVNVLGLQQGDPYLQAGVLVLDLQAMRRLHSVDAWIALASERKYRYNDQDILNKECKGRFFVLDMEWNTVVDCNHRRLPLIESGPYAVYQAYREARKHPKIVHYAGFEKPWDAPASDFAYLFWEYAVLSGFYDRLLDMLHEPKKKVRLLDRLVPRGSRRRAWAKRWLYALSGN
ncbi:MAG: glycosyltransferase family 8 protein [Sphaerochaeta sp.]|uniref:glycosyltransferase family 8 protein n=1 Tax=Sphaerochaeta sp. TaxID=1972642 RepID=UPI003D10A66C